MMKAVIPAKAGMTKNTDSDSPRGKMEKNGKMRALGRIFTLGSILLLGACFGGAAPSDSFYRLEVPSPAALPSPALQGIVEVGRFAAEGLTGERALLYSYRDKPDQVLRYGYQLWVEPPAVLLETEMVRLLRDAQVAPTVVTADLRVPPDFLIEGRLHRFEQVIGSPFGVVVEMELNLVRLRTSELLLQRRYRVEKPTFGDQPAEAVQAYQAAVGEIFGRFLTDLAQKPQIR
jgi:cholesterol transport system auxiliary component